MGGSLHKYLTDDHTRLDDLLARASSNPDTVDQHEYAEFRKGLLRHIGIEEKMVFPAVLVKTGSEHKELIAHLRLDHGALVSLLVPPPSRSVIATIRSILQAHNPLEEETGGLYDILEGAVGSDEGILSRMSTAPDVPVLPHNERPGALEAARRAVERAGHNMKSE
jgi:hypothetical protein